jgi:hypothetical protein
MSTTTQEQVEAPPVAEPVYPEMLEAARILRELGWFHDGDYVSDKGEVCILAAASLAMYDDEVPITSEAMHLSKLLGFDSWVDAGDWNDHPDRTLSEVLERLERAAWGL